ncbi:MAG: 30S ribosomal protein S6 [Candidatus Saccharibacteria bacterium]|nr:30S ribosomal protein S6 [Candidatus Saccharibacteria bacterium]MCY4010878.1 30S ribosomal protein S6 [Candidatus Saccharibacteria bacterium]MCY4089007.1 30S ribosomal protein S6 [Candidatus Saccharibacteria bacterium]
MNSSVHYELAVLYFSNLESNLDEVTQKVKKLITGADGKILKEDHWGKRDLAYKIKGETQALYVFYDLELPPQAIDKLKPKFNIMDEILRYMFHKTDLKALKQALDNPTHQSVTAITDGQSSEQTGVADGS